MTTMTIEQTTQQDKPLTIADAETALQTARADLLSVQ